MVFDDEIAKSQKTSEATLVDHALVATKAPVRLWPLALGVCAIFLTVSGVVIGYSHFEGLKAEIKRLSGELVYSRKQVAELIAENAILNKRLDTSRLDNPLTQPSKRASNYDESASTANEAIAGTDLPGGLVDELSDTAELNQDTEDKLPLGISSNEPTGEVVENISIDKAPTPDLTNKPLTADSAAIDEPSISDDHWTITVGTFADGMNRDRLVAGLKRDGYTVSVTTITRDGRSMERVVVVGFSAPEQAEEAAKAIEKQYRTGPLRVSRRGVQVPHWSSDSASTEKLPATSEPSSFSTAVEVTGIDAALVESAKPKKAPVVQGGWFIYITTFDNSNAASELAQELVKEGYNAKVAVEYRSGNLYYRVQVVGIEDRSSGEGVLHGLVAGSGLPNVQLRRY